MRHTVTTKDLKEWLDREVWSDFASSHIAYSHKLFEVNTSGEFRVTDHRKVTYLGKSQEAAVEAYNAAP